MKRFFTILFLIIILSGISINVLAESKEMTISINIGPMQELTVNRKVAVSFSYPWEGMDEGQPLIFNDVGELNIRSNVNWVLNVNLMQAYRELEIWVRPAGDYSADWQRINRVNGVLAGEKGLQNLSWDIKVTPARDSYTLINRSIARETRETDQKFVELMFTLTQS
jgi:hypothetical protein